MGVVALDVVVDAEERVVRDMARSSRLGRGWCVRRKVAVGKEEAADVRTPPLFRPCRRHIPWTTLFPACPPSSQ